MIDLHGVPVDPAQAKWWKVSFFFHLDETCKFKHRTHKTTNKLHPAKLSHEPSIASIACNVKIMRAGSMKNPCVRFNLMLSTATTRWVLICGNNSTILFHEPVLHPVLLVQGSITRIHHKFVSRVFFHSLKAELETAALLLQILTPRAQVSYTNLRITHGWIRRRLVLPQASILQQCSIVGSVCVVTVGSSSSCKPAAQPEHRFITSSIPVSECRPKVI